MSAARELTLQGTVLAWSAFEALARDVFVALLNSRPNLIERLLSNPANRKRFAIDKLEWSTLQRHNFDLSRCVGTLLAEHVDLDDIPTIKDTFGSILTPTEVVNVLADRSLWRLFQRRNLIVHRCGVVDKQFIEKTGEQLSLGSKLVVSPGEVESYLQTAVRAATVLLKSATNAL